MAVCRRAHDLRMSAENRRMTLVAGCGTQVMPRAWLTGIALVIASAGPVSAQPQTVNRAAHGQPDTDIRVGVYANVRPDCTTGPLPSIQLTSPPEHGKVTVKTAKVTLTNYKQCLAMQVPAFAVFYRSRPGFAGVDVVTVEVKFPGGRTELQRISVTVGTSSSGRGT